jgi:hypothetical protein
MAHSIVTRSQAGLKPPRATPVPMRLPAAEVWIHHTVSKVTANPHADWRAVQDIAFGRGFNDISYSYGVHPDGTILVGRGDNVGAHTAGRNTKAIGIVFIGNLSTSKPTPQAMDSARWLITHLKAGGKLTNHAVLMGHRQNPLSPSQCPGDHLFPRIGELGLPHAHSPIHKPATELTMAEHNLTLKDIDVLAGVVVDRLLGELEQTIRHIQHGADTVGPELRRNVRAVAQHVGAQVVNGAVQPPAAK